MITILSLDTTSKFISISISNGEETRLEYNFATTDNLSETLLLSLEIALNGMRPRLKLEDIDLFGIGVGPGLFTGIRIGMATLKGLLLGTGKPVVPVSILKALAYKFEDFESPIISLVDAKRKEVYTSVYQFKNRERQELKSPGLIRIDKLKEYLDPVVDPGNECLFIGSGADSSKTFIKENYTRSLVTGGPSFLASEICKIAYKSYIEKNYITDLSLLNPFYIRKPDAEMNYGKPDGNP
jgi:tRNA threonylcarbamoyladenosine biosynthesis protein TsaB